jgi:CheY-like chemotaxis protein
MKHPDAAGVGQEEVRAMAERQVVHLSLLVDDLMDVARISKGKLELKRRVVGLETIVSHPVEAVRSALAERGHELVVEPPADPVFLEADPTRLVQVLDNLLTNAIKYTEPGGRIVLSAGREGVEAVIRVADTGIGIPPEMLPRVFEMFAQVDGRSTRTQGGLGIGLGLVKGLVEIHGGTITATSGGPGAGSEFVVRLPAIVALPPGAADGRRVERDAGMELPCRRILVVDDNVDAANSLAKVLRRIYKQDVRAAHGGPEALAIAGEFRPEVVLLDIGMPGMDGYEVARRLRSSPNTSTSLLVALTGWGQDSDRQRAKEAGFDHHLVKPVDPEAIRALLADLALPVLHPDDEGTPL